MTENDPYTMEMRLCDDEGIVSDQPIVEDQTLPTADSSYLARLNRLRNMTLIARGEEAQIIEGAFACTGDAHLAGEHIKCTSPAHDVAVPVARVPLAGFLGHRSNEVHQWQCPLCSYTVIQSQPFTLDKCPACFDGQGFAWSAAGRTYGT